MDRWQQFRRNGSSRIEVNGEKPNHYRVQLAVLVASSLLLATLSHFSYINVMPVKDIASLPLVYRDISPIREQPVNPGGIVFSHQNRHIYQQLKKAARPLKQTVAASQQHRVQQIVQRYVITKKPPDQPSP